jgi:L-lactate dehydrogenase complex protein LldE
LALLKYPIGMKVQLFVPCFVDQLYPDVAFSMVKLLRKAGCTVAYNENQTCCGQPAFNAGFHEDAKEVCRKFLNDFGGTDPIVTPSASCAGFVRNYLRQLFPDGSYTQAALTVGQRVFELSEFLVKQLNFTNFGASFQGLATYHDSCAALRECNIKKEPRILLQEVNGLTIQEMEEVETCCGFGGTFAVKFDAISGAMADQKLTHAGHTKADFLISTDMSCLMHLEGVARKKGLPIKCLHLAEVLASGW